MRFSTLILTSMALFTGAFADLEWQVEFFTESDCQGDPIATYASGSPIDDSGCRAIESTVSYKSANLVASSDWIFELTDASDCTCSESFHGIEECPQQFYGNDIGTGKCLTSISNWKSWVLEKRTYEK